MTSSNKENSPVVIQLDESDSGFDVAPTTKPADARIDGLIRQSRTMKLRHRPQPSA